MTVLLLLEFEKERGDSFSRLVVFFSPKRLKVEGEERQRRGERERGRERERKKERDGGRGERVEPKQRRREGYTRGKSGGRKRSREEGEVEWPPNAT